MGTFLLSRLNNSVMSVKPNAIHTAPDLPPGRPGPRMLYGGSGLHAEDWRSG